METILFDNLESCIRAKLNNGRISISGGFRKTDLLNSPPEIDIIEVDSIEARTVRIVLDLTPPIKNNDPDPSQFISTNSAAPNTNPAGNQQSSSSDNGSWAEGWKAVFTSAGIIQPIVDPIRLIGLLNSDHRIKFFCDTNALANGITAWVLDVFHARADIITSAVVDREIMAWEDKNKDIWKAKKVKDWVQRSKFRLARGITECPPAHVVLERFAPDQSALMIAKLRDEKQHSIASENGKSPDADILLVELVRGLVRDMPRNSQIIFLTGDKGLARTAVSALGANSVLYASSDRETMRKAQGKTIARGWWRPGSPLGRVRLTSIRSIINSLFAACDYLILTDDKGTRIGLERAFTIPNGGPSDWTNPWVRVCDLPARPVSPGTSGVTTLPAATIPPASLDTNELDLHTQPPSTVPDSIGISIEMHDLHALNSSNNTDDDYIFPPLTVDNSVNASAGIRLTPSIVFEALCGHLFGNFPVGYSKRSNELKEETMKALVALGVISAEGKPLERFELVKELWISNDHEGLHKEFLRLPGYRKSLDLLCDYQTAPSDGPIQTGNPYKDIKKRPRANINFARMLGQAWLYDGCVFRGDNSLRHSQLQQKVIKWLPAIGSGLSTLKLCLNAATELAISPYRLEIAMTKMIEVGKETMLELGAGGTVSKEGKETIVHLYEGGFNFIEVFPHGLTFGGGIPAGIISRTS